MSLLVANARAWTGVAGAPIVRGAILVDDDGRIAALGPDAGRGTDADERLDARGGFVTPGFVNAHTHAAMTLLRGVRDDAPLENWLRETIWPAEAKLTRRAVEAGTRLALAEMLASGTTTFNDMYFFEDATAEVTAAAGMRAVIGVPFFDQATPERKPADTPAAARAFFERWRDHALITPALAPHAVYTANDETLATVAELAEELEGGEPHDRTRGPPRGLPRGPPRGRPDGSVARVRIHAHCSETRTEVQSCEASRGARPFGVLARAGLVGPSTVLAHCGWFTKGEVEEMARAGAAAAHCPVSNLKLATGGTMPLPEMLAAGVNVGLGTDGAASNNSLDMIETAKFTALVHKQHRWDATVASAASVLSLATAGGARALGLADRIGTLEVGKQADLVVWDLSKPHVTPASDLLSTLVYAAKGSDVATTVVAGRVLYERGEFRTLDVERTMHEAGQEAARLRS